MSTEPEALRLADALDAEFVQGRISNSTGRESAVELRRLHAVNQDLLEVLKQLSECDLNENNCATLDVATKRIRSVARATIARSSVIGKSGRLDLRQALDTEQEPVAWASTLDFDDDDIEIIPARAKGKLGTSNCDIPLYTAPPKREWVGLTLNEAEDFYDKYTDRAELINAIDKFLEEKNHG